MPATFCDNKCSLAKSIFIAKIAHKQKIETKPAKKLFLGCWGMAVKTATVVMAKLHQGNSNKPIAKANNTVRSIDVISFKI